MRLRAIFRPGRPSPFSLLRLQLRLLDCGSCRRCRRGRGRFELLLFDLLRPPNPNILVQHALLRVLIFLFFLLIFVFMFTFR